MEMCRACLSTGINMIPMDESTIENFNQITNLNIKLSNHMPLYICEECHSAMMFCKNFREKCIASDHTLNEILFSNNKVDVEFNPEDNDYYVVIKKESQGDKECVQGETLSIDFGDSEIDEIENEDTLSTLETITEPARNIVRDDFKEDNQPQIDSYILCGLCPEKSVNKYTLIEHLAVHKDDSNCQICLEPSNSNSELLAHRMQHVPDSQKGCLFCDRAFLSTASLQFHYMTVHKLDKSSFDELKQILDTTVKSIVEIFSSKKYNDASKGKKIAKNKKSQPKKPKVKRKILVVDTNKIELSEAELKMILEKTKEGFVPYYCGVCPQELEEKKQLLKHLNFHKMDSHCSLCELQFTSYPQLLAHRLAHVPDNQNSCLFCTIKIFNESELEQHYMNMHKLTEEALPYFCTSCFGSYETEKQLIQHRKNKHGAIKFICDYCSKGFRQKGALVNHIMCHRHSKNYKCDLCDYRAKFPGSIKEHVLRRHTETRVYCSNCRRAFPTIEMMERHKPCVVDSDLMCPICGVCLKLASSLTRHLRAHSDECTYKCGLCPSQYKSRSSFDAHMNKHNGTRKYQCEYCPKNFYSQPVLIKHRRIHTGERPYACKLCDRKFTGNHNLKVHMRVHGLELINKKK